ncbi:transcription repressor OFP13-like [Hordeum vulgare]|uniref:Transcription repressor n=1 Tax=Hordeum vulgare subsp. vulgare TaxID=112509 RepID=F2EAP7_HORVV|nr:transcription repressor OFP13-like [Hordeum vulgare]BAK04419.1 predicted protein [Hordeum vulgare subsp. vulgare]
MLSPGILIKKRHGGAGFALGCGCKDAKSVSVSASVSASPSPSGAGTSTTTETRRKGGRANPSGSTTTDTLTSASLSSLLWEDAVAEFDCGDDGHFKMESSAATQSFSGLLRELNELEQSVVSWGRKSRRGRDKKVSTPPLEHKQATMKSGDLKTGGGAKDRRAGDSVDEPGAVDACVEVGLDGSVAVVKQSEDPLSDFRQSMVQMIVENGIIAGEELRQMLRRFLTLNAPHHHDVILRAFAEIWDAVFSASYVPVPVPATGPPHKHTRREEPTAGRPPMPRTPPRHHHSPSPSAWRV